jgi:hypothetical protein
MNTRTFAVLLAFSAACTSTPKGGGNDLAVNNNNDMATSGGGNDFAVSSYFDTSANGVDTASPTDPNLAKGKPVRLTGVIVLAPVSRFLSHNKTNGSTTCKYSVDVTDAACTTPPCGLVINGSDGPTFPIQDLGSSACPLPSSSGSNIGALRIGDTITIEGRVDTFPDSMNAFIIQHSITADSVNKTSSGATVTPISVDSSMVSLTTHMPSGSGGDWMKYEGTYITLTPAAGGPTKFTITYGTGNQQYDFTTAPGNDSFGTSYYFNFGAHDLAGGGQYPGAGSMWSSLSGVVETIFGGAIQPTQASDFVP